MIFAPLKRYPSKADVLHLLSVQAWLTACHFFFFSSGLAWVPWPLGWLPRPPASMGPWDEQMEIWIRMDQWSLNGAHWGSFLSQGDNTTCTVLMYNVYIKKKSVCASVIVPSVFVVLRLCSLKQLENWLQTFPRPLSVAVKTTDLSLLMKLNHYLLLWSYKTPASLHDLKVHSRFCRECSCVAGRFRKKTNFNKICVVVRKGIIMQFSTQKLFSVFWSSSYLKALSLSCLPFHDWNI